MASRKRYRYTFEVVFATEDEKASFSERVERVRRKLEGNEGRGKWNNLQLLSRLLEMAEASSETGVASQTQASRAERLMNKGSGTILDIEGK